MVVSSVDPFRHLHASICCTVIRVIFVFVDNQKDMFVLREGFSWCSIFCVMRKKRLNKIIKVVSLW